MPTLVEMLDQLDQAGDDLKDAAGVAAQARIDYSAANDAKDVAEEALTQAKAAHAAILAEIEALT